MKYTDIQKPVAALLLKTDTILKKTIGSTVDLVSILKNKTPILKGKKIRASYFYLLSRLLHAPAKNLATIGAAIELFHLSSLIHDDIVDNSQQRRGERTLNDHFGTYLSVLWGDYLFIHSLGMIGALNAPAITRSILQTSEQMIEGQILEYQNSFHYQVDLATYIAIISKKTASLFTGISEIATELTALPVRQRKKWLAFGENFGIIFQISDDMLDIFSNASGKDRFRDLQEGKITLPYILLLQDVKSEEIKNMSAKEPDRLLQLFDRYHVKARCLEAIDGYAATCHALLAEYPASMYKNALTGLQAFIRYRDY